MFYHHPHLRRSYVVRRDEGDLLIVEGRLEFNDVWWAAHHLRKGLRTYPQGVDMVVAALEPLLDSARSLFNRSQRGLHDEEVRKWRSYQDWNLDDVNYCLTRILQMLGYRTDLTAEKYALKRYLLASLQSARIRTEAAGLFPRVPHDPSAGSGSRRRKKKRSR